METAIHILIGSPLLAKTSSFRFCAGAPWSVNAGRKIALLVCAVCVTPAALVTQVSGIWTAVWLVGLPAAAPVSEQKIESVARQSGYPNINTFCIAFRKAEDTTPAAFRKIARRGR